MEQELGRPGTLGEGQARGPGALEAGLAHWGPRHPLKAHLWPAHSYVGAHQQCPRQNCSLDQHHCLLTHLPAMLVGPTSVHRQPEQFLKKFKSDIIFLLLMHWYNPIMPGDQQTLN